MSYVPRKDQTRANPVADQNAAVLGLAAGTMVLTLAGSVRVEDLRPGDRLITRSGARALRALHIQPRHDAAMILIPAGALGAEQPIQNIRLSPDQQILFPARPNHETDTDAARPALVSADRLADATGTGSATITDQRLYVLELADAAVLYVDGLQLACRAKTAA
ncbi:MAG: Hint domain-containing protein [Pseudorhodobacter sp.]|nr:Hint domain-containing protein [Pseudorhodobacter sp.]